MTPGIKMENTRYMRDPSASILVHSKSLLAINAAGRSMSLPDPNGILAQLVDLLKREQNVYDLSAITELSIENLQPYLELLQKASLISFRIGDTESGPDLEATTNGIRNGGRRRFVIGISGSFQVVASNLLPVVAGLRESMQADVDVVLTRAAQKFVRPSVISHFGLDVWTDNSAPRKEANVPHMWLASNADLIFVVASARTVHKLAMGECNDLLSLAISATTAPVIIAPSMNPQMMLYPPVRRNLQRLKKDGHYILEPGLARELSMTSTTSSALFGGIGFYKGGISSLISLVLAERKHDLPHYSVKP